MSQYPPHQRGLGMLSPPSYPHAHHTHSHSYDGGADEIDINSDDDDDDGVDCGDSRYDTSAGGVFPSPPRHLSRPPVRQQGLVADPNASGEVRGSAGAGTGSGAVGRFTVMDGSPLQQGDTEEDAIAQRGNMSPFPQQEGGHEMSEEHYIHQSEQEQREAEQRQRDQEDADAAAAAAAAEEDEAQAQCSLPRQFFVPRFPPMNVNGESVELRMSLSALPRRGVYVSPSSQGLSFQPPKLKWGPRGSSMDGQGNSLERVFIATPLPDAPEGRTKVNYCIGGDDAAEYLEPKPGVFEMYAEDAPLPPMAEEEQVFSPTGGSDTGSQHSNHHHSNTSYCTDRDCNGVNKLDCFLAHGEPRQSGRFMVIDEEIQGSPSQRATSSPTSPSPSSSPGMGGDSASGGDNPLNLLSRLHASLSNLMHENERLRSENARLVQENSELRSRGGMGQQEEQRFSGGGSRTARIQPHVSQQQQQQQPAVPAPSQGRPRFATMPMPVAVGGASGVSARDHSGVRGVLSPVSPCMAAMRAALSPNGTAANAPHANMQYPQQQQQQQRNSNSQQQQQQQSAGMQHKRSSLPANMGAGPGAPLNAHARNSLPSQMQQRQTQASSHPASTVSSPGSQRRL